VTDTFDWVTGDAASVCALLARTRQAAQKTAAQHKQADDPPAAAQPDYLRNTAIGAGVGGLLGAGRALWRGQRRPGRILQDAVTGGLLGGVTGLGGTAAYDMLTRDTPRSSAKITPEQEAAAGQVRKLLIQAREAGADIGANTELVTGLNALAQKGQMDPAAVKALLAKAIPAPGSKEAPSYNTLKNMQDLAGSVFDDSNGTALEHGANVLRPTGLPLLANPTKANMAAGTAAVAGGLGTYNTIRNWQKNKALNNLLISTPEDKLNLPVWAKTPGDMTKATPAQRALAELRQPGGVRKTNWGLRTISPVSQTGLAAGGGKLSAKEVQALLRGNNATVGRKLPGLAGAAAFLTPLVLTQAAQNAGAVSGNPRNSAEQAMQAAGLNWNPPQ
jgi:hypothetical protein